MLAFLQRLESDAPSARSSRQQTENVNNPARWRAKLSATELRNLRLVARFRENPMPTSLLVETWTTSGVDRRVPRRVDYEVGLDYACQKTERRETRLSPGRRREVTGKSRDRHWDDDKQGGGWHMALPAGEAKPLGLSSAGRCAAEHCLIEKRCDLGR